GGEGDFYSQMTLVLETLAELTETVYHGFTLRQAQTQLYDAQNDYLTAMQQLVISKTSLSLLLNPVTSDK
ncbi:MAG: hypothetical protein ACPGFK_05835, partial [Flavobacteriaceae bacterium]